MLTIEILSKCICLKYYILNTLRNALNTSNQKTYNKNNSKTYNALNYCYLNPINNIKTT